MLNDFTGADKVYIACGYTDLRKGIDGLARLVQQQFALNPFTNTLFLFCGRRRDRIKGLYWEKDGFILLYKRLEQEFNRQGLKLSRQTMANWLLEASEKWLQSVYDVLRKQLCKEPVLHADETTLQVLKEPGVPLPASPTCGCTAPAAAQNRPLCCMSTSPLEKRSMRRLS